MSHWRDRHRQSKGKGGHKEIKLVSLRKRQVEGGHF